MGKRALLRALLRWMVVASAASPIWAQMWPKSTLHFTSRKPVLGLPLSSSRSRQRCANDGTLFFDIAAAAPIVPASGGSMIYLMPGVQTGGGPAAQDLYSISMSGEVKHLLRKLPIGFNSVNVKDFFAGENTLVTLLEAERWDNGEPNPREVSYFLSKSDHVGDLSSLVQMDVRFKPLRVAILGPDSDVLVLGWDMANELPLLAVMKDDGTVRRFIDLDQRSMNAERPRTSDVAAPDGKEPGASKPAKTAAAPDPSLLTLDALQGAVFVPFGDEVMLTYPGTTKPVLVLNRFGEIRTIHLALPAGFVLHDVLVGVSYGNIAVRARPQSELTKDLPPALLLHLFELNASSGKFVREFVFDKPQVADVTCAAKSSLTAIFYDPFYDPMATSDSSVANASSSGNAAGDSSQQLVVSSVRVF